MSDEVEKSKKILKRLVTLNAAARFLGVSKHSIYGWTHRNEIPYRKIGSRLRFDLDELNEWTRKQVTEMPADKPVNEAMPLFASQSDIETRVAMLEETVKALQSVIRMRSTQPVAI